MDMPMSFFMRLFLEIMAYRPIIMRTIKIQ